MSEKILVISIQSILLISGILISQIHLYFILVVLLALMASHLLYRKSTGVMKHHYLYLRKTSMLIVIQLVAAIPMITIPIFIEGNAMSIDLIRENFYYFNQLHAVMLNLLGLQLFILVSFLVYRSYKLLKSVIKSEDKYLKI